MEPYPDSTRTADMIFYPTLLLWMISVLDRARELKKATSGLDYRISTRVMEPAETFPWRLTPKALLLVACHPNWGLGLPYGADGLRWMEAHHLCLQLHTILP